MGRKPQGRKPLFHTIMIDEFLQKKDCDGLKAVSRDAFLLAMRQAAAPVCVLTINQAGQRMALTVSSFVSVSADPPLISVCINRQSRMADVMKNTGSFVVHMLAADQAHVADAFAGRPQAGEAYNFSCVDWISRGPDREPLMAGAAVAADCSVVSVIEAGSHLIFIGIVSHIMSNGLQPLLYWNRNYTSTRPEA